MDVSPRLAGGASLPPPRHQDMGAARDLDYGLPLRPSESPNLGTGRDGRDNGRDAKCSRMFWVLPVSQSLPFEAPGPPGLMT